MNSIVENCRYKTKKKFIVFCNMHEICQCAKLNQIYILPVTFYTANWIFIYPTNIVYNCDVIIFLEFTVFTHYTNILYLDVFFLKEVIYILLSFSKRQMTCQIIVNTLYNMFKKNESVTSK